MEITGLFIDLVKVRGGVKVGTWQSVASAKDDWAIVARTWIGWAAFNPVIRAWNSVIITSTVIITSVRVLSLNYYVWAWGHVGAQSFASWVVAGKGIGVVDILTFG